VVVSASAVVVATCVKDNMLDFYHGDCQRDFCFLSLESVG
jgi:hypothetical protein